jgi:hypothetical protein
LAQLRVISEALAPHLIDFDGPREHASRLVVEDQAEHDRKQVEGSQQVVQTVPFWARGPANCMCRLATRAWDSDHCQPPPERYHLTVFYLVRNASG